MFCSNCGINLSLEDKFCRKCGNRLTLFAESEGVLKTCYEESHDQMENNSNNNCLIGEGDRFIIKLFSDRLEVKKKKGGLFVKNENYDVINLRNIELDTIYYIPGGLFGPSLSLRFIEPVEFKYSLRGRKQDILILFNKAFVEDFNKIVQKLKDMRTVKETKCSCRECGKVWHFNDYDVWLENNKAKANVAKALIVPILNTKEVLELKRCPECGSRNVHCSDSKPKKDE